MKRREHWSRQSVAGDLTSFVMHVDRSQQPAANSADDTLDAQQMTSTSNAEFGVPLQGLDTAHMPGYKSSQKCREKLSGNESLPKIIRASPAGCRVPVCIGSLERSWSAATLL